MVNREVVLFLLQLELDSRLQRALTYDRFDEVKELRDRRNKVDGALRMMQSKKGYGCGSRRGMRSDQFGALAPAALSIRAKLSKAIEEEDYVAAAALRDKLAELEEQSAEANWGVRISHGAGAGSWAGTSWLEATGDTLDLTRFHDLVCATAEQLRLAGDDSDLETRKARALGVITDLASGSPGDPSRATTALTRLYLHVNASDLDVPGALGRAEKLGPVTLAKIHDWLSGSRATILPVVDLARADAVDRHAPPQWMRELVVLRDRRCRFPWCGTDARRCDVDHITPYVDPGRGGPPDQTHPANLAALCRRHHRLKPHGGWRYLRTPDGSYPWRSPLGRSYAVTTSGTLPLG